MSYKLPLSSIQNKRIQNPLKWSGTRSRLKMSVKSCQFPKKNIETVRTIDQDHLEKIQEILSPWKENIKI